jgi:acylphosphatase
MKKRLHIKVFGFVQGVNYRNFTKGKAKELGLTGMVRNASRGTVEAVFEGEESNLKRMLDYCRKGPAFARVEKVEAEWSDAKGEFPDFSVVG